MRKKAVKLASEDEVLFYASKILNKMSEDVIRFCVTLLKDETWFKGFCRFLRSKISESIEDR